MLQDCSQAERFSRNHRLQHYPVRLVRYQAPHRKFDRHRRRRYVKALGDKGAVVLTFTSSDLQTRWQDFKDQDASWDYEDYHPHITITYQSADLNFDDMEPYKGPIELGPEEMKELNEDFVDEVEEDLTGEPAPAPEPQIFRHLSYGELLHLAMTLQDQGDEVLLHIPNHDEAKIGDGIVPKADNFHECLGGGWIFIIDGCENAKTPRPAPLQGRVGSGYE